MYYINETPNEFGYYGNPISQSFHGCMALPDEFLGVYLDAMGFATITAEDGIVTSVAVNQAALDAYHKAHPEPPREPTIEERVAAMEQAIEKGLSL
mgnify:CR=1 FL=1